MGEMKGSIHVMLDVRCFFGFLLGPGTGNLDHALVHGMKYARDFEVVAFLPPLGVFS